MADPIWGGKLTGKIGRGALGFFAAQDRINNLVIPSNQGSDSASLDADVTSGVFRYRYDIGKGSTIGALYTGRTADDYHNHTGGVDAFFRLGQKDQITFQFLRSDTLYPIALSEAFNQPKGSFGGNAILAQYIHQTRNLMYYAAYQSIDPDFRADYGYLPRVDTRMIDLEVDAMVYGLRAGGKSGKWFDQLRFWIRGYQTDDFSGRLTDSRVAVGASLQGPAPIPIRVDRPLEPGILRGNAFRYERHRRPAGVQAGRGHELQPHRPMSPGRSTTPMSAKPGPIRLGPDVEFGLGRHFNLGARLLSRTIGRPGRPDLHRPPPSRPNDLQHQLPDVPPPDPPVPGHRPRPGDVRIPGPTPAPGISSPNSYSLTRSTPRRCFSSGTRTTPTAPAGSTSSAMTGRCF